MEIERRRVLNGVKKMSSDHTLTEFRPENDCFLFFLSLDFWVTNKYRLASAPPLFLMLDFQRRDGAIFYGA